MRMSKDSNNYQMQDAYNKGVNMTDLFSAT